MWDLKTTYLAGYARHRGVFKHRGWNGLQEELEKDFYRLWKRNLGIWAPNPIHSY